MKRRLRKKKRVGEFQEHGFELHADLRHSLTRAEIDAFTDRLLRVVDARKLAIGGGIGRGHVDLFVSHFGRGSVTEDDRQALAAFLDGDEVVLRCTLGELRDAWHG